MATSISAVPMTVVKVSRSPRNSTASTAALTGSMSITEPDRTSRSRRVRARAARRWGGQGTFTCGRNM